MAWHFGGAKQYLSSGAFEQLKSNLVATGYKGIAFYILVYICLVTFGLPNLPFQIAAGSIYGSTTAFLMMYLGVNFGAFMAFSLARTLGRKGIEELWGHKLEGLNKRIEKGGLKMLLIMRLIPMLPFNATNYASGISRLKTRDYVLATALGTLPLTFLHVYFGSMLNQFFK
ncbi:MAG: VTT domain-containing protein [Bdellovibrionota bacterium]